MPGDSKKRHHNAKLIAENAITTNMKGVLGDFSPN